MTPSEATGITDCLICGPARVRYIYGGEVSNPELWFIHIRTGECLIQLDLDWPEPDTSIFTGPIYEEDKFLISFNYLVDITPQTATKFAHRFLNLKAFL